MTDEQLLEAACDYDPAVMSTVIPAFRAGGLDAGFEQLFKVRFSDDPENLALIMEADRRGDFRGKSDASGTRFARSAGRFRSNHAVDSRPIAWGL